jgi:hypothetical protein
MAVTVPSKAFVRPTRPTAEAKTCGTAKTRRPTWEAATGTLE